jgi:Tat protein secretion system quality control protein TatD with DNase activity
MARKALDAGFHLSLAGIVTFPKALELKEVARLVPLDRLLIETDSPFLAPVPHRVSVQRIRHRRSPTLFLSRRRRPLRMRRPDWRLYHPAPYPDWCRAPSHRAPVYAGHE